jgi:hypothetical protein
MLWMSARIRRYNDQLHNGFLFSTKDNPIYPKLSTYILPKRYMFCIDDTLRHKITNSNTDLRQYLFA